MPPLLPTHNQKTTDVRDSSSPHSLQASDLRGLLHPRLGHLGPTWIYPSCYHGFSSAHGKEKYGRDDLTAMQAPWPSGDDATAARSGALKE